jgi:hypothetical protein
MMQVVAFLDHHAMGWPTADAQNLLNDKMADAKMRAETHITYEKRRHTLVRMVGVHASHASIRIT